MAERDTIQSWWRAVPLEERPGLKVLCGLLLIVMTLAAVAWLSPYIT